MQWDGRYKGEMRHLRLCYYCGSVSLGVVGFQQDSSGTVDYMKCTVCPHCGKEFSTAFNMRYHMKNVHESKPYEEWEECHVCQKRFKTHMYLLSHLRMTHRIYSSRSAYKNPNIALDISTVNDTSSPS